MGRAFEYRKARKFKRWNAMSKAFTKIGKEIAMAVKANGPDVNSNSRLRAAVQAAKAVNMPKANVEAAIKKASSKDASNFEEVVYEGYGPNGVAILIETATDNTTRTVANIRHIFTKHGGTLGTQGSLDFVFTRKGQFRLKAEGLNVEELELELIDHGLDEIQTHEDEIIIFTPFAEFGTMQKYLEEKGLELLGADKVRIALSFKDDLAENQEEAIMNMVEKFEEDDDVQQVFTNLP